MRAVWVERHHFLLCSTTTKNVDRREKKICFCWWCCDAIIFAPKQRKNVFSCIHYLLVVRRWRLMSFVSHFSVRQSSENQNTKNLVFHSVRRQWEGNQRKKRRRRCTLMENTEHSLAEPQFHSSSSPRLSLCTPVYLRCHRSRHWLHVLRVIIKILS